MNFIQKIVEAYDGHYSQDVMKKFHTPGGMMTYQPTSGLIQVGGSEISINFKEAGGILRATDPVRIILRLKGDFKRNLSISPCSYLDYILDALFFSKGINIPKKIRNQFSFRGNKKLIEQLVSDEEFTDAILDEFVYITLNSDKPERLMLTPAYGIRDLNHFDNLISILKIIEAKIKSNAPNNGYDQ